MLKAIHVFPVPVAIASSARCLPMSMCSIAALTARSLVVAEAATHGGVNAGARRGFVTSSPVGSLRPGRASGRQLRVETSTPRRTGGSRVPRLVQRRPTAQRASRHAAQPGYDQRCVNRALTTLAQRPQVPTGPEARRPDLSVNPVRLKTRRRVVP
jgi:hypothetical protein